MAIQKKIILKHEPQSSNEILGGKGTIPTSCNKVFSETAADMSRLSHVTKFSRRTHCFAQIHGRDDMSDQLH